MAEIEFDEYRPLMFSIAYGMTGSVADAEDIVQDAFAGMAKALRDGTVIESPRAYLATATTRRAITHLQSARVRRESYVGEWLPEPVLTDFTPGPADRAELADSLSMAFLVLLEALSPAERAVFLLREAFGYEYAEIASVTDRSETACRQLFSRARRHIDAARQPDAAGPGMTRDVALAAVPVQPRQASPERRAAAGELATRFFSAAQ